MMALTIDEFVRRVTARAKAHQHAMRGMTRDAAFKYIRQIIVR
jgi:hypothetical protein